MSQAKRLVLILILGITLRLGFLVHHDIWFDEAVTILISRLPLLTILESASLDNNPPMFDLLMHPLVPISINPMWLRLPSLLFSILTIPTVYLLSHRLTGAKTAILSALVTVLMPVQLYYSGEARPYSLLMLLSTLLFYLAVRIKQPKKNAGYARVLPQPNLITDLSRFLFSAVLTASLLLTHYSSIVVIMIAIILALKYSRTQALFFIPGTIIGSLLVIPWYMISLSQPHALPWNPSPLLSLAFLPVAATSGFIGIASPRSVLELPLPSQAIITILGLITTLLLAASLISWLRKPQWPSHSLLLLLVFIALSTVTIQQFSNVTMFLSPRLILPFTPLIYILIAKQLEPRTLLTKTFLVLTCVAIVINFLPPARGPRLREALQAAQAFELTIVHTAPTTFYPSLISGTFTENLYIGPQIFPSQLTRMIGGIPIPKSEAVDLNAMTLVIDTKNTLPQVNEAVHRLLEQTHLLTDSKQVNTILIQHFKRIEKLFAKDLETM